MTVDMTPATIAHRILNSTLSVQSDLSNTSIQISTGNKYQDFKGFAADGNVERYLSFNSALSNIDSFIRSNNLVSSRLKTMDQSIGQVEDIASQFAQSLTNRRNSASGDLISLGTIGENTLEQIETALNVKFDGRYLFSGSKTDTPPVNNILTSTLSGDNDATDSYYQGDNVPPTVRASETQSVEYGVLGNEDAFQKLIGAVHLAIQGHENDDDNLLSSAVDMLNEAIDLLPGVRAKVLTTEKSIDNINSAHTDSQILISNNSSDLANTDLVQASALMSAQQAQLQASYMAFSKAISMRLANFL